MSGTLISGCLVGGIFPAQPVQGISSLVDARDGTFLAMADNGFGTLDNSADFHLRSYRIVDNLASSACNAVASASTTAFARTNSQRLVMG